MDKQTLPRRRPNRWRLTNTPRRASQIPPRSAVSTWAKRNIAPHHATPRAHDTPTDHAHTNCSNRAPDTTRYGIHKSLHDARDVEANCGGHDKRHMPNMIRISTNNGGTPAKLKRTRTHAHARVCDEHLGTRSPLTISFAARLRPTACLTATDDTRLLEVGIAHDARRPGASPHICGLPKSSRRCRK